MVAREAMPARVSSPHTDDFTATLHMTALGPATVLAMEHPRLEVERTAAHIRQADPEAYVLLLNLAGCQRIDQERRTALVRPGDFTMYHSSRPMRTYSDPTLQRESAVVLAIPHQAMPLPPDRLLSIQAVRMPGDRGLGAVVSAYLQALATVGSISGRVDIDRLGQVTLDLVCLMLSEHAQAPLPEESGDRALHARIETFVLAHLHDAQLTPEAVAAAHHVSLRTLQRLCQARGTSVAAMIRDGRLAQCRRDLADPALRSVSIAAVARRWGIAEPASFSRAFRRAFGQSPAEYRHAALSGGPGTPLSDQHRSRGR
jgi:AraC-like DNA-binding protein